MRIVIDIQGLQASNSNRGIGRYTLSLTQSIIKNRGEHEIHLMFNSCFPDSIEFTRTILHNLLPQENIHVWTSPYSTSYSDHKNDWIRQCAELTRENALANIKPDMVLVSSLFEGLGDNAVTSIGKHSCNIPTSVIHYDLIPLIHHNPYLEDPTVESWYLNKLDHLRRTDLLLAISEYSRQEAMQCMDFDADAVINISSAVEPHFSPKSIIPERKENLKKKYGILHAFVMYTGGIDHRKNIEGLIRSYAKLPVSLRSEYQLAIVCSIQPSDRQRLELLAKEYTLKKHELILTDFVPEEDLIDLYNLCTVFVFPSWHEGFGLPALEAMSCGKAVIGANTSSLPEVIGHKDALFDPRNDEDIAAKLSRVLTDHDFRKELESHGLEQAKRFSWDISAKRVITAFEHWHEKNQRQSASICMPVTRPKLAYISPLPPERSGISDYSAELLPELSRFYHIDVIVAQTEITDPFIKATCTIRSIEWFRAHAESYDRVIYHFGNSSFHQHMFSLLEEIPGIIVLHDFFLSGIVAHMDIHGIKPNGWPIELYKSHGYKSVKERFHTLDSTDIIWKYPCNLSVLQNARGIITHSENSLRLTEKWYRPFKQDEQAVIPLLRTQKLEIDCANARNILDFKKNDFIVCSFGLLGSTKLNHRLIQSWISSNLAKQDNCFLVFVGDNHPSEYGQELNQLIHESGLDKRIRITGWVDHTTFHQYLAASDIGVQLRTLSRGETSASVLDCMNYGLATIINANGSMADLPNDQVWKLPDEFTNDQLIEALETLWQDYDLRKQLGTRAREAIRSQHNPRKCATQYHYSIENFYQNAAFDVHALSKSIAQLERPSDHYLRLALPSLSTAIAHSIPPRLKVKQLLIDISELVQLDSKTGIQRVVRSILQELLNNPPKGIRVEPVYASAASSYRYARRFTFNLLNCPSDIFDDEPIEYQAGDIFLGLDLQPHVVPVHREFYQQLRNYGVDVRFIIYDLLPILLPHCFLEGAMQTHKIWLEIIAQSDGVICISKAVADELNEWLKKNPPKYSHPFKVNWFHLGADITNSAPTRGIPNKANNVFNELAQRPTFLTVGTLEPRKGQTQTLGTFELLWQNGINVNLVFVGKRGWMIDTLIERLYKHPELNKRLFWLEGISDEYLEKTYAASTCLIAASEGEGFGLPLIEAAHHKLPIIARDIPVFREVAGEHAFYFSGKDTYSLADAIQNWLQLHADRHAPSSEAMPSLTWKESAEQILDIIFNK
jgi:glycosyltransferase involved in cell wall biosynthesis